MSRTVRALGFGACVSLLLWPSIYAGGPPQPGPSKKVLLEIDRMPDVPALVADQIINGVAVSLKGIYKEAGIAVEIVQDPPTLPQASEVTLAQLHALMLRNRSSVVPADTLRVQGLIVSREQERPDDLGIMFDVDPSDSNAVPREGFAIFADVHKQLETGVTPEMLLTAAHELAHVFNLHHTDWEGNALRRGSTVEGFSGADSVRWALSGKSKTHLSQHTDAERWPGPGSLPWGFVLVGHAANHQSDPIEEYEIVSDDQIPTARRAGVVLDTAARAAARAPTLTQPGTGPVRLDVTGGKPTFLLGEPIRLSLALTNTVAADQYAIGLLDPAYGFLTLDITHTDSQTTRRYRPIVLREARSLRPARIQSNGTLRQDVMIAMSATGELFTQPGRYEIVATFPETAGEARALDTVNRRLASTPLVLQVLAPKTSAEAQAARELLKPETRLFLALGGGQHLTNAARSMATLATQAPNPVYAQVAAEASLRAALAPSDVSNTTPPTPQIALAEQYLKVLEKPSAGYETAAIAAKLRVADALFDTGQTKRAADLQGKALSELAARERMKDGSAAISAVSGVK